MRALGWVLGVGLWIACAGEVVAQQTSSFNDRQIASCPAIFPILKGERSLVVPTVAPQFAQFTPRPVVAAPASEAHGAAKSLLQRKLKERDRLQREIAELRTTTKTPEQVLVRVKVLEIDRTKLAQAGLDLKVLGNSDKPIDLAPILYGEEKLGLATIDNSALTGVFEMLEKQNFAKILASPSLVTISGVPASLNAGGELLLPAGQGGAVMTKEFGTRLDVTATTLGDDKVRLEIRPRVATVNKTQGVVVAGQSIPAISLREIDTACEIAIGKSFLLSGLVEERLETRRVSPTETKEEIHEVALVVVATPELVR
jgi:Flp pilus assembly secretin CpaC